MHLRVDRRVEHTARGRSPPASFGTVSVGCFCSDRSRWATKGGDESVGICLIVGYENDLSLLAVLPSQEAHLISAFSNFRGTPDNHPLPPSPWSSPFQVSPSLLTERDFLSSLRASIDERWTFRCPFLMAPQWFCDEILDYLIAWKPYNYITSIVIHNTHILQHQSVLISTYTFQVVGRDFDVLGLIVVCNEGNGRWADCTHEEAQEKLNKTEDRI